MHHIFVSENFIDKSNHKIVIEEKLDRENFDHLVKSLRINVGEFVLCSKFPYNMDFSYICRVSDVSHSSLELDIVDKEVANELKVKINLYQGLPKSDKLEFIIEKAVELGVYSITPVEMTNSVAKINEKLDKKLERYEKIAKSAAEQSRRNIVPEVKKAITYNQMISEVAGGTPNILFYENVAGIEKTKKHIKTLVSTTDKINIIIGPEGGFADKEIEKAKINNIEILSLGSRILRTETAAITALGILMYEIEN